MFRVSRSARCSEVNSTWLIISDQANQRPWQALITCVRYTNSYFALCNEMAISLVPFFVRAVFKWLSKVITWLRLLRSLIGLKDSRQFFNQRESKPKPIAPCTRDFFRTSSELQLIARNCDWFIALSAAVVIGRSNCFGFGFSTVIWKPL